jgi:radical SAM-linked protein
MLYISHLDLSKTIMRSVMRTDLPIYYTEGFNPIPKLVFATPLSVGCGGDEEILDLRMMKSVSNAVIEEKLRAVMPNGIEIVRVYEQMGKLNEIKWAENEIEYSGVSANDEICREIEDMFTRPVVLMKRSKSGERECDITSLIRSVNVSWDGEKLRVSAVTSADSENYLNPAYVAQAIESKFDIFGEGSWHIITRKKLMYADGSDFN